MPVAASDKKERESSRRGRSVLFLVHSIKSKQKAPLKDKGDSQKCCSLLETCRTLSSTLRTSRLASSIVCAGQATMNPLNTFWVRVLFSWRGKGKRGCCFSLVSAAVCGEPQMPSVDGRPAVAPLRRLVPEGPRSPTAAGLLQSHCSARLEAPLP